MESGRRSGMTLSKRRRTRVIKSSRRGLPSVEPQKISMRPSSRRADSRIPDSKTRNPEGSIRTKSQAKRLRTKKAQMKRTRSKSPDQKREKDNHPSDPMISTSLSSVDLEELRGLERIFLDNQTVLRKIFPPPPEASVQMLKQTPPPSRRSAGSAAKSRSALANKGVAAPHSRAGVLAQQLTKPEHLERQSRGEAGLNRTRMTKEQAAANMISDSVKYIAREWPRMDIIRDLIPSAK